MALHAAWMPLPHLGDTPCSIATCPIAHSHTTLVCLLISEHIAPVQEPPPSVLSFLEKRRKRKMRKGKRKKRDKERRAAKEKIRQIFYANFLYDTVEDYLLNRLLMHKSCYLRYLRLK